ncbi:hypothetical protein BDF20DRAFT_953119 [Mycotypha africana]|uniref:uncharacterized protein n=1 Tax=Mycotypha africana TaxID=64632 RepID=UPI002300ED06|nr:uncharacterized protein BDF20DRAFT_953119 [Mycotypha africana]KAI8988222.1 hypothetical protein BDF20DRAFT_953119 [Mycotypha africana]
MSSIQYQYRQQPTTTTTNTTTTTTFQPYKEKIPSLSNNRMAYVDALIDANAQVIESIWDIVYSQKPSSNFSNNMVVPLRTFIQEVLKRSRTTYSTLQTALYYIFRSRQEIRLNLTRIHQNGSSVLATEDAYISCGRRMFLASLITASKFVQDKTYRNSAWAKIAGLPVMEVNVSERIFLKLIDYNLYIAQPTFEQWYQSLHKHVEAKTMLQHPTSITEILNSSLTTLTTPTTMPLPSHLLTSSTLQQVTFNSTSFATTITPPHTPPPTLPLPSLSASTKNNIVLPSPSIFLLPQYYQQQRQQPHYVCPHQTHQRKKRKTNNDCSNFSNVPSLPSSSDSTPMQTPSPISNDIYSTGKKRKYSANIFCENSLATGYNIISHVRQQTIMKRDLM